MNLLSLSRTLRRKQTPWEQKLWRILRNRNIIGQKFRRQYPIGPYITDFCCVECKLIIELDGSGHLESLQTAKDSVRSNFFISEGFEVLRIYNNEIDSNIEGVVEFIIQKLK